MRSIVIQIDNTFVAFEGENANQIVSALDGARVVDYEGWYDSDKDYIINTNAKIEIKFIDESRIKMPEKDNEG